MPWLRDGIRLAKPSGADRRCGRVWAVRHALVGLVQHRRARQPPRYRPTGSALQTTLRHELTAVFALLPTGIQGERGGMKRVDWMPFANGPPSAEKAAVFGGAGAVAQNGYTTVEAALRERYCDFWLPVPARPP